MNKTDIVGKNWKELTLEQKKALMIEHIDYCVEHFGGIFAVKFNKYIKIKYNITSDED